MTQWEPMPPQGINFVPFAFESKQIQGFNAASLLRVQETGTNGAYGNISPLSNAQYTELLSLVAGTSTQFGKPNTLGGRTVPTFNAGNAGQVLGWNGTDWVATTPSTNASTSTKLQSTADPALGVSFQVDPTIATNYTVTWPATAGAAGQTVTSNGFGVLSWVTPLTTTTGFAQGGNSFGATASLGTSDNEALEFKTNNIGRLTINAAGKIGIGTSSPAELLDILSSNPIARITNSSTTGYSSSRIYLQNTEVGANGGTFYFMNEKLSAGAATGPTDFQLRVTNSSGDRTDLIRVDSATRNIQFNASKTVGAVYGNSQFLNGNVGVGSQTPTAVLHLKAGSSTTSSAPFKLTSSGSGVLLASPEDGAMEYDGTGLWFTVGSN
ncbi:MAG: hypothetical protein EOP05_18995, partial [Proteobacteria bacterium]